MLLSSLGKPKSFKPDIPSEYFEEIVGNTPLELDPSHVKV